jgi:hypothetical protein
VATRADAERIVETLKQNSGIRRVELFGSVLKYGIGHDIDLIVLVDKEIAHKWWQGASEELRVRMGTWLQPLRRFIKTYLPWLDEMTIRSRKARRLALASELTGVDFVAAGNGIVLDVFLLPEDWRVEDALNTGVLEGIVPILHHRKTRMFLELIAKQVSRI